MSMQQLQTDLAAVMAALPLDPTGPELATYLKHNLLPLIAAHISETLEIDEAVGNLIDNAADVLHEDTAAVFGSLIVAGLAVCAELRTRAGTDVRCRQIVAEFERLAKEGEQILQEITVEDDEDDEAPPEGQAPEGTPP